MNWILAIDYGTTNTSAAAKDRKGTHVLDLAGRRQYPSCVHVGERGEILTGTDAENVAVLFVDRFVATPKRRLSERTVVIGGTEVAVVDLVSATLRAVYQEAVRSRRLVADRRRAHASCPLEPRSDRCPARRGVRRRHARRDGHGRAGRRGAGVRRELRRPPGCAVRPVRSRRRHARRGDRRARRRRAAADRGSRRSRSPGRRGLRRCADATRARLGSATGRRGRSSAGAPSPRRAPRATRAATRVRSAKEALSTHESAYVVVPGVEQPLVVTPRRVRRVHPPACRRSGR